MTVFWTVMRRDLLLAFRQGGGAGMAVTFFVVTVTLFPLGVGPEPNILARIGSGVVWVSALLAALLSLDRLFQADLEDGGLDLLALSPEPLEIVVLAKCLAHWLSTGLPLIIVAPLLGLLMGMSGAGIGGLVLAMLLGTPALSLIGAVGAGLTVGVRRGGVLLSLLVLPLYIPVLIFGVSAVEAAATGLTARPHLLILTAMSLFTAVLAPLAAAAAVRLSLE